MKELIQVSENVWIPVVSIKRITRYKDVIAITFFDSSVERFEGEDAERIIKQLER